MLIVSMAFLRDDPPDDLAQTEVGRLLEIGAKRNSPR